ncbi:MAG: penicillin-binding transpeptidase domain-containing protein [Ruminococcus flavefaciens]|nr:penicillin-binding transpeptidase domain-containing protein [Ruminococcus flavefaciens]MCM1229066.1 penicillin-binding transpeptidase domain-containing protein [Ruminococcus flavefaciens]
MANNKNLPTKSMKIRAKSVMTIVFLILFFVVARNFFVISVIDNEKYQAMANDQHFGSITISAHRGSIYDSKGMALAKSASVYKVFLDPKQFKKDMENLQNRIDERSEQIKEGTYQPEVQISTNENGEEVQVIVEETLPSSAEAFREEAVAVLSGKLGITAEKVTKAMEANNQYSVLQEQVEKPVADEVLALFNQYNLTSLNVEEDTKRYYPQNELAAAVIGFTSSDGYGMYGIESYYDDYLSGTDGRTISAKDSNGNELPYRYSKTYPAQNGNDVYLTLDMTIQYYLEKNLEEMSNNAMVKNRSCAILMNAKTGAIYGMAQYPSYDLNNPYIIADSSVEAQLKTITDDAEYSRIQGAARETQWRNKCVTENYEPGSVFKVITSAAAFEENLIDVVRDSFFCNGFVKLDGMAQAVNCHDTSGHGAQTYQEALTHSCNPAFMEIGARLGEDKFQYYFDAFGLKEPTGIDLPAESGSSSNIQSADLFTNVDLAMSSIGQNHTITPLEMITAYCAAINGGYLLQPYVVEKVLDEDGNVVLKNERTVRRQVVSEETSAIMREALHNVATDGNVTIKGYAIGGKSGTSQRLSETEKGHTLVQGEIEDASRQEYGASYVCFAPADDPEIVLLVLADMPDYKNNGNNYYGSQIAVPTAREILTEVLPYLGISPEYTEEELAELDIKVPLLEGSLENAKATLDGLGAEYEVIGSGTSVVKQSPITGSSIAKGGTVYLYTDSDPIIEYTVVPNLIGVSPEVANESIIYSRLNYVATGASINREGVIVEKQSPEAGEPVPVGTTVELEFMVYDSGD